MIRSRRSGWASKGAIVSLDRGVDWRLKLPGGVGGAVRRGLSGEGVAQDPNGLAVLDSVE